MDDAWNLLKSNILCSRTVVGLGRALGTPRCDVWQTVQEKDCERHVFFCVAFGVTSTTKGNKHHNLNLSQNRVCFMHLGHSKYSKVKTRMKLYQFPAHTYLDFDLPQSVYSQDSFLETNSENSEGTFWWHVSCYAMRELWLLQTPRMFEGHMDTSFHFNSAPGPLLHSASWVLDPGFGIAPCRMMRTGSWMMPGTCWNQTSFVPGRS